MRDEDKSKEDLIEELQEMRRRVCKLSKSEVSGQTSDTRGGSNMFNIGADFTRDTKAEARLQEGIDTIEALLNATRDMVYLIDPDGTIIVANHRGVEYLGGSHQKLIGASIFDFLPPKLATERREKLDEVIRSGSPLIYEDQHYVRHFEHSLYPIPGEDGVQRIAVYSRDISNSKRAAKALEESKEEYKRLIQTMNEGLWVQNEDGVVSFVNDRLCEMLGYSAKEMIGHRVAEFLDEPSLKKLGDRTQTRGQQGAPSREIEWSCKDGRRVWTIVAPSLLYDAEGEFLGSFAVVTDITEHKRAQGAVSRANEDWKQTFDAIPDMVMVLDTQHRILRANKAMADALGMTERDLIGGHCFELVHGETAPPSFCPHSQLLADGEEHSAEVVERLLGATLDVRVSPIRSHDGQVRGSVHVARDITGRKRSEEAMREREEFLSSIVENIPDMIFIKDAKELRFVRFNNAGERLLGYRRDDLIGKNDYDFFPKEQADFFTKKDMEVLASGRIHDIPEEPINTKTGRRILHTKKIPLLDKNGTPVYLLGISEDITEHKRAEERLRESEERFRGVFENAAIGIDIADSNGRFLQVNRSLAEMLGYTENELLSQTICDVSHPDDVEISRIKHEKMVHGETESYRFEKRYIRKSGEIMWADVSVSPVRGRGGVYVATVGVLADITDRKQAETELRKSNDLLRAIIQAAPTAIIGLDLDGNVQTVWNPAAEKMLGWSAQEVMGRPLPSVPAESQEEFRGFREWIRSGKTLDGVEVRRQRRDGTPIDYSIYASPLHDSEGRISGNVCVLVDMTERKRAEQALRASEEKYRTLFIESIDGVYSVLRGGQITDANASFCDIFGYTRQEMIGKDVRELYVNPVDRQRFQKEIEKRGFVKDYEVKLWKRDGTEVDCLLSSSVYFGADGSIAGYRGILRDLTLPKVLQRQLLQAQKMESIGNLAGGIAHDFNNLLQVIVGYSDMLLFNKKPSDREYEGLHAIRQAGRDGAELAKRILAFSRRLEPDARPLNLNNEIGRVQKMLKRTVPKIIRIEILLADNLMTVNADPGQMEQILLNLAVNAQHAMPDGGRLTIETANVVLDEDYSRSHLDVEPGRYVLLSVSDTGHGMDREVLEHIFEPFYTTKGASEGTGLGLAMVFGIVRSHKGHIMCYSEPGAGTTFKIYLPAIVQEIEQDLAVTQQMPAFGTETILLVDDEKSIRNVGEQMLRMAGYKVLTATNGREALEIYRSNQDRIALVILDLMMPEMGGKQCLQELLKINLRVKVLIASGYSAKGSIKDGLISRARGFVDKPYDMKQVLKAIRQVMDAE